MGRLEQQIGILRNVRWLGGDTEDPLAGLSTKHVLGVTHFRVAQKLERSSFINSRVVMASGWEGFSPFPSYDYPEYETPFKQYENGPITYFAVITGLSRPYHDSSSYSPSRGSMCCSSFISSYLPTIWYSQPWANIYVQMNSSFECICTSCSDLKIIPRGNACTHVAPIHSSPWALMCRCAIFRSLGFEYVTRYN